MNIIKANNYEEMSKMAAIIIGSRILQKPDSVLGFATGSTPIGTYARLVEMHREGLLDFGKITTFNLDEYYGTPDTDKNSYYYFMCQNLFNHVNIGSNSIHLPNGTTSDPAIECASYEKAITNAGGVDLQLLGIGHNGHIGFNEPSDEFAHDTHHVMLADSTIDANTRFYNNRDEVPRSALTMGIGTIMRAKSILLLISGSDKRDIAKKALYGPVTPSVPASILQYHANCTVILAVG